MSQLTMQDALRFPRPFGRYLLLKQLAVGGMAEVYLAKQSGPAGFEKECVIKRILPSLAADQQFVQMFLDEARIAARLSHPNIVQIFELGEVGPQDHFIAMEHVHGVDVQQILEAEHARNGRVPLAVALRLCSSVAEGLDAAHRATDGRGHPLGIVHRDVTPSNVIVSFDGVAKICDFGIAKAVARGGRTEVGVIKGKIPYMSPEQVQGEAIDARSDLFSVGTMLYELTVGQKPFIGTNPAELSLKILHDEPQPPELVVGHYPPPLDAVVKKALAKRKEDRYATGRDLQMAIDEFLMTSGIRCTSHDVGAYLDELFPGRRDLTCEADLPLSGGATDPTVPMHMSGGGRPGGEGPSSGAPDPVMRGDLSTSHMQAYDDVRRNLGGGGGGMKYVVFFLIVAVAVGFWYLRGHMPGEPAAAAPPVVTSPAAAPGSPKEPKEPAVVPAPTVVEVPKPVEPHKPSPTVTELPAPEPPKPAVVAPKPVAKPRPVAHKPAPKPHKPAAKPSPAPSDRPLPHLPSPPPAEDDGT